MVTDLVSFILNSSAFIENDLIRINRCVSISSEDIIVLGALMLCPTGSVCLTSRPESLWRLKGGTLSILPSQKGSLGLEKNDLAAINFIATNGLVTQVGVSNWTDILEGGGADAQEA